MNIEIRFVEIKDAPFIVELRNNPRLNQYLSPTSAIITDQEEWIKAYKQREALKKEFYFLILENGYKRGLYRIYHINNYSFTIGSWLFTKCEYVNLPILTDLLFSDFGFSSLKLPVLLFDVRKENRKVIQYHLLKNPIIYSEDELNYYYLLQLKDWAELKNAVLSYFNISENEFNLLKLKLNKIIN
jgi:hypothetical protein